MLLRTVESMRFESCARRHGIGQRDTQPEGGDPPSQYVVVGKVIDQGVKPADAVEVVPAQAHRRAKTILPSNRAGENSARQKYKRDLGGAKPRRQAGPNPG